MKLQDINNNIVNVDVRQSSYPRRSVSKSELQTVVGKELEQIYPNEVVLEEFFIPGSKMSVDFFLPGIGMVVEVNGIQHSEYTPFFHGDRLSNKFARQKSHDVKKARWAEYNGFKFVEIYTQEDINGKLR